MSALPKLASWGVFPVDGGWRIVVPGRPASSNATLREHWSARSRRRGDCAACMRLLRAQCGIWRAPALDRADLRILCYFPSRRTRDPANYGAGAGAKALVDALVDAGWLPDDDAAHLRTHTPEVRVGAPERTELELRGWGT